MKENDGVEELMKNFQIEYKFQFANQGKDSFMFDLKENGSNIPVTYQNRKEYIKLFAQWLMIDSVYK